MIRVLLVEDHILVRMGLSLLLEKSSNISLIGEAEDGMQGVNLAKELNPDVILMDIGLPGIDGIRATRKIKETNPNIKILIFTSRDSEKDVFEAFGAGADGYIMKGASQEQTIAAIETVNSGAAWLDSAIAKLVLNNINNPHNQLSKSGITEISSNAGKNQYGLTEREMDVLSLMVAGQSNNQIAETLVITKATAKAHVHNILQKLCVATRTQATITAMKEGLV